MRDLALSIIIFGAIPYVMTRPFIGVLLWTWLAYFNPQKMTYGFALRLPFSQLVGGATLLAWLFSSKEPKKLPMCAATVLWVMFFFWMTMTTLFAVETQAANDQLIKVFKIQIFALLTVIVTNSWERVRQLIWCIVLSIGYFSLKGGIWVIRTGGSAKVWGPSGTFIEGNNELALATLMTIPLAYFLYTTETVVWRKRAIMFGIVMSSLSVAGSFSRGAMLAAAAMAAFLTWRSKNRFSVAAGVILLGIGVFAFMPESWTERLQTIQTYKEDGSAMKRINTWTFAWNFVKDHPIFGGGYEVFLSRDAYVEYAPRSDEGWIFQDAHSNYLKVLAEHGFPGLTLFILIFVAGWFRASKAIQWSRGFTFGTPQSHIGILALMLQSSIVAYFVGGTFLGLCYFDLPYNIVGLCVVISTVAVQTSFGTDTVGAHAAAVANAQALTRPALPNKYSRMR
jgi:probable O-glycosylation ligase (exosortase A-associated)